MLSSYNQILSNVLYYSMLTVFGLMGRGYYNTPIYIFRHFEKFLTWGWCVPASGTDLPLKNISVQ